MSLNQRPYGPGPGLPSGQAAQSINVPATQASVFPATVSNSGTAETVVPNPALSNQALIASIPDNANLEQIPFFICASGNCAVSALTTTLTIKLYSGVSLTVGSDILLKTSGAITPTHLKFGWFLEATAQYDSVSGLMQGTAEFTIDGQWVTKTAFAAEVTGVSNSSNPVANFVLSATFSANNAANVFNVQAFSVG